MDNLVQDVFEMIVKNPGIDTPEVCLRLHLDDSSLINLHSTTEFEGYMLAKWLSKWFPSVWDRTCAAVDTLIEDGRISFSDDGELRAMG